MLKEMQLIFLLLVLCCCLPNSRSFPPTTPNSEWRQSRFIIDNRKNGLFTHKTVQPSNDWKSSFNETFRRETFASPDGYRKDLSAEASIAEPNFFQKYNEDSLSRKLIKGYGAQVPPDYFAKDFGDGKNSSGRTHDSQNLVQNDDEDTRVVTSTEYDLVESDWTPKIDENVLVSSSKETIFEPPTNSHKSGTGEGTWKLSNAKTKEGNLIDKSGSEKHVYETRIETVSYHQEVIFNPPKVEVKSGKENWYQTERWQPEDTTVYREREDGYGIREFINGQESKRVFENLGKNYKPLENNYEKPQRNYEEPERNYEEPERHYEEPEKNYEEPGRNYEEPERNYEEPEKNYEEPERNYEEPERNYEKPERNYEEPEKNYEEPERNYEEPEKNYEEPERNYEEPKRSYQGLGRGYVSPETEYEEAKKSYEVPEKTYKETSYQKFERTYNNLGKGYKPVEVSEKSYEPEKEYKQPEESYKEPEGGYKELGRNFEKPREYEKPEVGENEGRSGGDSGSQQPVVETEENKNQFGYVVEGENFRKYRVEERTPDGFIVGEFGVVSHDDGSLRGVRYTADGTTNPQLIYETLIKFLSL